MINRFRIQSFKIIGTLDLTLDRLTVLVGPNACGKSSVLEAMSFLCRRRNGGFKYDIAELTTRNAAAPLLLRAEGESFKVEWAPEQDARTVMPQDEQTVFFDDFEALPKAELFRFEFDNLARPEVVSATPVLGATGYGMASVLGQLTLEHPQIFERIKEGTRSVIPSVRDIRVRITTVHEHDRSVPGFEVLFDTRSGASIPARAMSDGTLRVLALLTAALGNDPPRFILLDDIERGVHPRAMIELVCLLQKALVEVSDLQIVATTHSPDLLDQLDPAQIRLLWLGEDGLTRCEPMNEHRDFDTWRDIMTPGEMWSVFDRANAGAS